MTLKNKFPSDYSASGLMRYTTLCITMLLLVSCGIYKFNDASIDPNIKTVKIGYIDNKARYINPQFAAKLTDRIQQKIISATKLTRTNNDDADYVITSIVYLFFFRVILLRLHCPFECILRKCVSLL